MINRLLILILVAVAVSGCKPETDTERPTVELESPAENDVVTTDDGIRLVATILDNTGILQYKLAVSGIDSLNDVGADSTYSFIQVESVSNETSGIFLDETFALPDDVFNGYYFATLTAIDVEGNEAIRDTSRFRIVNSIDSEPPVFDVAGPTADTLGFGQGFALSGSVTDSQDLIFSDIFIGRSDFSDTIQFVTFPWISNNLLDYTNQFSWYFQVDSAWVQGQYHIRYTAWDNYSGVSHEIPFYVSY